MYSSWFSKLRHKDNLDMWLAGRLNDIELFGLALLFGLFGEIGISSITRKISLLWSIDVSGLWNM